MIYKVTLNGKRYEVEVEKGEAILLDVSAVSETPAPVAAIPVPVAVPSAPAAAPVTAPAAGGEVVAAPLPGSIIEIKVTAGQAVTKGQLLMVIEAMKMENEILAPRDGTISQVVCEKGSSVETGSPLVFLA